MTKKKNQKHPKKLLEVMDMFITLVVMIVSQALTYAQTRQILYIKYVPFSIYVLNLNKAVKMIRNACNKTVKKCHS